MRALAVSFSARAFAAARTFASTSHTATTWAGRLLEEALEVERALAFDADEPEADALARGGLAQARRPGTVRRRRPERRWCGGNRGGGEAPCMLLSAGEWQVAAEVVGRASRQVALVHIMTLQALGRGTDRPDIGLGRGP